MSATVNARKARNELAAKIDAVRDALAAARNALYVYPGERDPEWPADEPVPLELSAAVFGLEHQVGLVTAEVADAKRQYRKRCLEWLLTETEASR